MSFFDSAFYTRFYVDKRTRVTDREEMTRRARAIAAMLAHLEVPVRRILDAGCGLGWMRAPLLKQWPQATYTGLEVSEHLCERYGWVRGSLASYRPRGRFDLIICYDVLQYLDDTDAKRAMANIARLCRGALYFHAPTHEDWRANADRSLSDGEIHLRPARWYRERLATRFRYVGCGLHVRRGVYVHQWEMEKPG